MGSQRAEEALEEHAAVASGGRQGEVTQGVSSACLPFASFLGEDSSDAEAPGASPLRGAPTGGVLSLKEAQAKSSEEAESAPARGVRKETGPPQPARGGFNSFYKGKLFNCIISWL